ncbi:hypothetical protein GCM10010126_47000 [Planomonospora parontospora]|uniref:Uncharacterized protein n=1 Tax=Planomonospora parontospora TaxID=58119 RepID=A0AA37F6L4_9ACTN|nr:hypothetical protein GCM10010126_47000 [Planomonospora parontospora]
MRKLNVFDGGPPGQARPQGSVKGTKGVGQPGAPSWPAVIHPGADVSSHRRCHGAQECDRVHSDTDGETDGDTDGDGGPGGRLGGSRRG